MLNPSFLSICLKFVKGGQIMYEIFSKLLHTYGVTPYKVSKETGVSQSTLSDWKLGKVTPKSDTMKKLADYFGVSIDYLMTGKEGIEKEPQLKQIGRASCRERV